MSKTHGSEWCKRWALADIVDALPRPSEIPLTTLVFVFSASCHILGVKGHTCNVLWKISLVCLKPLGLEIPGSYTNCPFLGP